MFSTISGVAAFLFGLMASYTISDRHSRLNQIVENGSIERGEIAFMADILRHFPKKHADRVTKALDEYLMANLDYPPELFYHTDKEFEEVFEAVYALPGKTKNRPIAIR